jgi:pyruvate/2-oxoacid:ferredoxin oxidoreductase beta subunit
VDFPQLRPVNDYLKLQGRFRHLPENIINEIQKRVNEDYTKLREKSA